MSGDKFNAGMGRGVLAFMLVTDLGLLAYWGVVSLAGLGVVYVPPELMFSDYHNATVVVWNWSFLPLDVILSLVGLASVRFARKGDVRWLPFAIVSLSLTFCAGLMALSFWAIRGDFDISWWGMNLYLMFGPLIIIPVLMRKAMSR